MSYVIIFRGNLKNTCYLSEYQYNTCDLTILFYNFSSFVMETYYKSVYVSFNYNNTYYLYINAVYCQPCQLSTDGVVHCTVWNRKQYFGHLMAMVSFSSGWAISKALTFSRDLLRTLSQSNHDGGHYFVQRYYFHSIKSPQSWSVQIELQGTLMALQSCCSLI